MTLAEVLEAILVREGWPKYTENHNDRGGPTKGGVTLRTLEEWRGRRVTRAELKALKKVEALKIFQRMYAESNGIQHLVDHSIQPQLVDHAVLSGPQTAVKDLQRVVGVSDDGIIGPVTVLATKEYGDKIHAHLAAERAKRLGRIVAHNRKEFMRELRKAVKSGNMAEVKRVLAADRDQSTFLNGWLARALEFA